MEEYRVDEVIGKLLKIEATAIGIQSDSEKEKVEYAEYIARLTREFDDKLELETADKLKQLKDKLRVEKKSEMQLMKSDITEQTTKLENMYNENHEKWVNEIVERILKE